MQTMQKKCMPVLAIMLLALGSTCQSTRISSLSLASVRTIDSPTKSNTTWVHPSEIAKDCLNSVGKSLEDECRAHAEHDYDPSRLNTSKSTIWETCCALYEELDCYLGNAKLFCPESTRKQLVDYTEKVVIFFQDSLCHTVIQVGWRFWCNNMTHQAMANHSGDPGHTKPDLIKLPEPTGDEKACFQKLHNSPVDYEQKCLNDSLNHWDPKRDKLFQGPVLDSCCAYYTAMDCLIEESGKICDASDAVHMKEYRSNSLKKLSTTLCKKVPADNSQKLCGGKSGALTSEPSFAPFFILTTALLFKIVCESIFN